MSKPKVSPDRLYNENLTVVAACLELGGAAIFEVMGGDAVSNQVHGEKQSLRDIQEMIGSRLAKSFGV